MSEPSRDLVLEEIVAILRAGLTGVRSWGGEYPMPPIVTRAWRPIDTVTEFPYLIVSIGSGSALEEIGAPGHYLDSVRGLIYGYVRGDDVVPSSRWLLRLQDDVISELIKAPTLNAGAGAVARIVIPQDDETDDGQFEPLAAFRQTFTIQRDEIKAVA